ncbi:MAG: phage tail tape measure protein [Pseudomonadota bacterium]
MNDVDGLDDFASQIDALDQALSGSQSMAAAVTGELVQVRSTVSDVSRDVRSLSASLSAGVTRAFEGLAFDGARLSDTLRGLGDTVARAGYRSAISPVAGHFGGLLASGVAGVMNGLLPFADGAGFAQGRVMPFANGGVVSGPVAFPMRGGTGVMGEAGPEAIMPLTRGADGKLGVRSASGGRPMNVVINVSTPDVAGFERSRSQMAAQVSRMLSQAQRNG